MNLKCLAVVFVLAARSLSSLTYLPSSRRYYHAPIMYIAGRRENGRWRAVAASNTQSKLIWYGNVRVYLNDSVLFVAKETERHWRLQFLKMYATPVTTAPTIKVSKEWGSWIAVDGQVAYVEIWDEPRQWWREPRSENDGIPAEERGPRRRTIIKIYKPRKHYEPRYVLLVTGFEGKRTRMGGYQSATIARVDDEVFAREFESCSKTCRHWFNYFVAIGTRIVLLMIYRSNSGNIDDYVIVYTPKGKKTLPRFEIVKEVASDGILRHVVLRDNVNGREINAVLVCARDDYKHGVGVYHEVVSDNVKLEKLGAVDGCEAYKVKGSGEVTVRRVITIPVIGKSHKVTIATLSIDAR